MFVIASVTVAALVDETPTLPAQNLQNAYVASESMFGASVAISGSIAAAGLLRSDALPSMDDSLSRRVRRAGVVQLFDKTNSEWQPGPVVVAFDADANDQFGFSLDLVDQELAVGSWHADNEGHLRSGAVYIVQNVLESDSTATERLNSPEPQADAHFGVSVSFDGDMLAVGEQKSDHSGVEDVGFVHLFSRGESDRWQFRDTLKPSISEAGQRFGRSVSFDSGYLAVGVPGATIKDARAAGAVELFKLDTNSGEWTFLRRLSAPEPSRGSMFGDSVVLSEDSLFVGAWREPERGQNEAGAVYVFDLDALSQPSRPIRLVAPDGSEGDRFGVALSFEGDRLVVGAHLSDRDGEEDAGAAYVFQKSDQRWRFAHAMESPNSESGGNYGRAVATDGESVIIGAEFESSNGPRSGRVYVVDLPNVAP